jgi:hypothetical protein
MLRKLTDVTSGEDLAAIKALLEPRSILISASRQGLLSLWERGDA